MALVIELPADLEALLRADAEAQRRTMADVAAERLTALYRTTSLSSEEAEIEDAAIHAALYGRAHPFDPDAIRAKYGLPAGRTREEIEADAEEIVARMDPQKRAEAERLGLL